MSKETPASNIAADVCRAVAELPDRNSPTDWPEAMLVTHDELATIVTEAMEADRELRRGDAMPSGIAAVIAADTSTSGEYWKGYAEGLAEDFDELAQLYKDAQAALAESQALAQQLKQEAQIHAQEARTANATIAEIYQLCTGATGEPGNWHGAEPVRAALAAKDVQIEALRSVAKGSAK